MERDIKALTVALAAEAAGIVAIGLLIGIVIFSITLGRIAAGLEGGTATERINRAVAVTDWRAVGQQYGAIAGDAMGFALRASLRLP